MRRSRKSDDPPSWHVRPLCRCFLCHEDLDYTSDFDAWGRTLITCNAAFPSSRAVLFLALFANYPWLVFPCTNFDGSPRVVLRAVDDLDKAGFYGPYACHLASRDGPNRDVYLCKDGPRSSFSFASFCDCDERVMFLSHECCWKAINQPRLLPSSHLVRLAKDTWPVAPPRFPNSHGRTLGRQTRVAVCAESDTPLSRLLTRIARQLPPELQCMILDHLSGSPFASLLKTTSVASQLLHRVNSPGPSGPRTIGLDVVGRVLSLSCRSSDLFGLAYLTHITHNQHNQQDRLSSPPISVESLPLRGIQYALGEFGLRALRVLYEDGSRSAWLGDPSGCWYGIAMGQSLGNLSFLVDDFRILRLWFGHPTYSSSEPVSRHILWDRDSPLDGDAYSVLVTASKAPKIPYYPDCRPFYSLPLTFGSEYASGITVYLESPGRLGRIRGIASHGPRTCLLGQSDGLPIHLPLAKGQYVTGLWVYVPGANTHPTPKRALCVITNHESVYFGNFRYPAWSAGGYWKRVNTGRPSMITGILLDAATYQPHQVMNDLGVVESYRGQKANYSSTLPPKIRQHKIPSECQRKVGVMSMVSLYPASRLEVRKDGRWRLGLRIFRRNGTAKTLGRWDPDTATVSTIYDETSDGPLTGLAFQLERTGREDARVRDIIPITHASRGCPEDEGSSITRRFSCERDSPWVSWWFDEDWDHIAPYTYVKPRWPRNSTEFKVLSFQ